MKGFAHPLKGVVKEWEVFRKLALYHPYRYPLYRPWIFDVLKTFKSKLGRHPTDADLFDEQEKSPGLNAFETVFSHRLLSILDEACCPNRHGLVPLRDARHLAIAYLFRHVIDSLKEAYAEDMLDEELEADTPQFVGIGAFIEHEQRFFLQWAAHTLCDRPLYHFEPALTALFQHSSIANVTMAQIQIPHDALYLHFGRQVGYPIYGPMTGLFVFGRDRFESLIQKMAARGKRQEVQRLQAESGTPLFELEGAYVCKSSAETNEWQVLLVSAPASSTNTVGLMDDVTEAQGFPLRSTDPNQLVEQAFDEVETNLYQHFSHFLIQLELDAWDLGVDDPIKEPFRQALQLVVNGLLYLSTYPEAIVQDYPAAAFNAKPKERTKFPLLHFCGRDLLPQPTDRPWLPGAWQQKDGVSHWQRPILQTEGIGAQTSDKLSR